MHDIYYISCFTGLLAEKQCLCQFVKNFIICRTCTKIFNSVIFNWWSFTSLVTLILIVWCIIISVLLLLLLLLDILKPNFGAFDIKKNRNKYIALNDIKMNFTRICETEILPQYGLKIDFINRTLSFIQFQK